MLNIFSVFETHFMVFSVKTEQYSWTFSKFLSGFLQHFVLLVLCDDVKLLLSKNISYFNHFNIYVLWLDNSLIHTVLSRAFYL